MKKCVSEKLSRILADERLKQNLIQELQLIVAAIIGVGLLLLASLSGGNRAENVPLSPPLNGPHEERGEPLRVTGAPSRSFSQRSEEWK